MKITLLLIASLAFVLGGVPKDRFDPCIFVPEECNKHKHTTTKPVTSSQLTTEATIPASTHGTTPKSAATTDSVKDISLDKGVASNMVIVFQVNQKCIFLVKLKLSF